MARSCFYEASVGGVDIIKDDELIGGDRVFNRIEDRVRANMAAAKRAEEIKGEPTLYACNITDEVTRLKENAMKVIENGGNCIMVDVHGVGYSAVRALAEDPDITVPILGHSCFNGRIHRISLPGYELQGSSQACPAGRL